ncbi:alpha/beta hydrolase [Streptomyces sp. 8K308]|uniref:alpha/beta fold hydrolase n=1 Tax=Streptomyces sp. 8K308 TaxID=2530388 RepID=UPI00104F69DB|nr:alpha/beta hydrolase [Streptomyces sp. 8K308]TDC24636.1 alpha/beta hydrolase [Streptomyces sp. 8K308]
MPPVVFLHGLIGPFADERAFVPLHPSRIIAPDLLGYGANATADPGGISIDAQVEHLRTVLDLALPNTPAHLVGHSVGGVIAATFAHRFPDRTASFVNVEGNFTLADAFWSAQIATKTTAEVEQLLRADRAEPERWLRDGGIEPSRGRVRSAAQALAHQPATTVQAMARAVVDHTARADYERSLREVFERTPVHLVAGARSRPGWHVPEWALAAAATYTELPGTGHMVMLEAPEAFGALLAELIATAPTGPRT